MSIDLYIFIALIFLGYFFGRRAEKNHFKSIIAREQKYSGLLMFSGRVPPPHINNADAELVGGSVVISVDYFKRIVAGLKALIGGRLTSYESLLERARREAILRMKEDALAKGASMVINVKLETSSISKGKGRQIGCIEVYAYGTALSPIS